MDSIELAARYLRGADNIVAFTGAGISTESGIPDFRSANGLWNNIDPKTVATNAVLYKDPSRFWDFYWQRLAVLDHVQPNQGHYALQTLADTGACHSLITQNIDGLHQAAGSTNVIEIHGSGRSFQCMMCDAPYRLSELSSLRDHNQVPVCIRCPEKGVIRPLTVLFGEYLPAQAWEQAQAAAYYADVLLVLGTSLTIPPASGLPNLTLRSGGHVIVINRDRSPLDTQWALTVHAPLGKTLQELVGAYSTLSKEDGIKPVRKIRTRAKYKTS